jgi:hypothetical protein
VLLSTNPEKNWMTCPTLEIKDLTSLLGPPPLTVTRRIAIVLTHTAEA